MQFLSLQLMSDAVIFILRFLTKLLFFFYYFIFILTSQNKNWLFLYFGELS